MTASTVLMRRPTPRWRRPAMLQLLLPPSRFLPCASATRVPSLDADADVTMTASTVLMRRPTPRKVVALSRELTEILHTSKVYFNDKADSCSDVNSTVAVM
jgi:hypothetical protein